MDLEQRAAQLCLPLCLNLSSCKLGGGWTFQEIQPVCLRPRLNSAQFFILHEICAQITTTHKEFHKAATSLVPSLN